MSRRLPAVLALAAALASLAVACGGSAQGPELTDPNAIVAAALTSTEAAKTVHIGALVDGKATVALPIGGKSGSLDLTGTTAAIDVDRPASALRATFRVPNVLNLAGELIVVDGKAYLKTTLTGVRYRVVDAKGGLPIDPTNTTAMIGALRGVLQQPGVKPVKGPDVACGSKQCYTVSVELTADQLAAIAGPGASGLPVDLTGASLSVTIRVEKDLPYHHAGVSAKLTSADGNVVTLEMTMSKWDQPVTIVAPPADQVAPSS
jgi:hypothetical protein